MDRSHTIFFVDSRFDLLDSLVKRKRKYIVSQSPVTNNKNDDALSHAIEKINNNATTPYCYRAKTRSILERTFNKGLQMLGVNDVDVDDPDENGMAIKQQDDRVSLFCSLFAYELERELFLQYPSHDNSSSNIEQEQEQHEKSRINQMSKDYREKLRSLRHNLEDVKNPTLCARVLLGHITINKLVRMSSEEMASKKLQRDRVKAEEEAKKNIVLDNVSDKKVKKMEVSYEIKNSSNNHKNTEKNNVSKSESSEKDDLSSIMEVNKLSSDESSYAQMNGKPINNKGLVSIEMELLKKRTISTAQCNDNNTKKAKREALNLALMIEKKIADYNNNTLPSFQKSAMIDKGGRRNKPSSPLPLIITVPKNKDNGNQNNLKKSEKIEFFDDNASATTSFSTTSTKSTLSSSNNSMIPSPHVRFSDPSPPSALCSNPILSQSGNDNFKFFFSSLNASFSASLHPESPFGHSLSGWLPKSIADKGRLEVDELNKFAFNKMQRSWVVIPLRVSLANRTKQDFKEYKRFYKEFELKNRIPIFEISKETKLFFITPKFVKRVECLRGGVSKKTSSYVIVVMKNKSN